MTKGGAEAPPQGDLSKGCHLEVGRLAVDALAGVFYRALEGLPLFANDVLVGGNRAFGCHAQGVRLDAHVGCELALTLGSAVETDRPVAVFVAGVICGLGRGIAGSVPATTRGRR